VRFLFYDSVISIEKGRTIIGVKTFPLSEEFYRGHFKKNALVPGVILIEAMAQLLGWLIIYTHDFKMSAIMSLIEDVRIPSKLRPGCKADIHCEIISTTKTDSLGSARMYIEGREIASMNRIIYSHFYKVNPEELMNLFCYYSGFQKERLIKGYENGQ
jgi:3-hydroxyacyl-[acyl-carrier-protein] dehydratase